IHGGSGGGGGSTPSETMFTVYDLNTNKPVTDTKLNIIAAITNNEIGNMSLSGEDFRNLCKAQAVAANSWVQHQYENQGTIPNVGLKYSGNYGAVKEAIFDVQSKVITYNGRTANTVYTSCNNGKTNSARNYLKTDAYPYLTVVDSPYDTQVFRNKTMTRNEGQVANDIRKFSIDPYASGVAKSSWIQIIERDPQTNYVTRVSLCGQEVPISKFNENMIGPYSPDFNVNYSNGVWTFVANGNGHCMGLSQYGAYYYAIKPTKWYDILAIYFPGTKIEDRF
ncbi:MAG: SpoIID/LytB domain-containing protein, partial [Oscillospiraceae bacterium]